MEKTVSELMEAISPEDWEKVPEGVLKLIEELVRRVGGIEKGAALLGRQY
jgi:hypothetical protein